MGNKLKFRIAGNEFVLDSILYITCNRSKMRNVEYKHWHPYTMMKHRITSNQPRIEWYVKRTLAEDFK